MTKTVITLDFETAWRSSDYSLSRIGTEHYIRHELFHPLLLAVKVNSGNIVVFEEEQIEEVLKQLPLNDPNVITVAQNASFDISIIEMHYGIKVANPVCTRSLARLTGVARLTSESLAAQNKFHNYTEKKAGTVVSDGKFRREDFTEDEFNYFKSYNADDVEQTHHHFTVMLDALSRSMTQEQLDNLLAFDSITTKMYARPILELNQPLLAQYEQEILDAQEAAMQKLQKLFAFNDRDAFIKAIRSRSEVDKKGGLTFIGMLRQLGMEPPKKVSEKRVDSIKESTAWIMNMIVRAKAGDVQPDDVRFYKKHKKNIEKGELTYALAKTDEAFMDLMESESNEEVALLCRTRAEVNSSIELSRCRTFLSVASRGTLPVPLAAYQAHSGRFAADNSASDSKSDSLNVQNLSKRSGNHTLRRAICAPDGYVLVAADSSQVELRVNAFVWQQHNLLEALKNKQDIYCDFGHILYGRPITKADKHERNVSKTSVLQLGYQSGAKLLAKKFKQSRLDVSTEYLSHEEECERITETYRNTYSKIKDGWKHCINVIMAMNRGSSGAFGGPNNDLFCYNGADDIFGRPAASVQLPDGYKIFLPNLRWVQDGEQVNQNLKADGDAFWYDLYDRKTKSMKSSRIYGGKLTALCLAEGTQVMTDSGWKPIESVSVQDLIWDGIEYVNHTGVMYNGIKDCIDIDGVNMTPDHLIMEGGKWISASQLQRPDRPKIREADSNYSQSFSEWAMGLGISLRLWRDSLSRWKECHKGPQTRTLSFLHELFQDFSKRSQNCAWAYGTPGLEGLEAYERPMFLQKDKHCMEELCWKRNYCLREMAGLRKFLSGYVRRISAWLNPRSHKHQWELYTGEYSMGFNESKFQKQARQPQTGPDGVISNYWNRQEYTALQNRSWLVDGVLNQDTQSRECEAKTIQAGNTCKKVYDITNCGPRNRFVIKGIDGPMLSHNCVQGLSFAGIRYQMRKVAERYQVVLNVHDEIVAIAHKTEAQEALDFMLKVMRTSPPWLPEGLVLDAEGKFGRNYSEV